jgi:PAS domain S-box-containing protein
MASPRLSTFRSDQLWREAEEPTFWLDKALRFVWVNRAWEALTGYPAERVLGVTCKAHAPVKAGDVSDLAASFHPPSLAMAGQPVRGPTLILHAQGEKLWRHLEFWPFHDRRGELIGFLGRVHDPTSSPLETSDLDRGGHGELIALRQRLCRSHGFDAIIGLGDSHDRLLEQVRLAGGTSSPVLILGEPGTGKRSVARLIHDIGADRLQPIHFIDLEALPAELMERRLFSLPESPDSRHHRESDALDGRYPHPGRDPATIAVGDIIHLPRDLQSRLSAVLRAKSGPRLLAMSSVDPEAALRSERLRPDLFYALTPLVLRLQPLRERGEEIMLLAQHFLERANRRGGPQKLGFAATAQAVLRGYDWPGNLSELERVVNYAHEQGEQPLVTAEDLPASIQGNLGAAHLPGTPPIAIKPLDEMLTEIERRLIENALAKARRNKTRAADLLGISRPRLYRRMKELNLDDEADPDEGPGTSNSASPGT